MDRKVSKSKNKGRETWNVNFYHPLITNEKTGEEVRIRRSTFTDSEEELAIIVTDLEILINNEEYHNIVKKPYALTLFNKTAVELFYNDIQIKSEKDHEDLRAEKIPMENDNQIIDIEGFSGAGKTSLLSQLLGLDVKKENVLATSSNKTTVSDIEFIIKNTDDFSLVCTFKEKQKIEDYVRELIQRASHEAIGNNEHDSITRKFTETADKEFRLHYIVGTIKSKVSDTNSLSSRFAKYQGANEQDSHYNELMSSLLDDIIYQSKARWKNYTVDNNLDLSSLTELEKYQLEIDFLEGFIKEDIFLDYVDQIMKEIETTINKVLTIEGLFVEKTRYDWISYIYSKQLNRVDCLNLIEKLATNKKKLFGEILTPIVESIRVQGPFFPDWVVEKERYKFTFVDGRGLDHVLKEAFSVPLEVNNKLRRANKIIYVQNGSETMSHNSKVFFENLELSGYTPKIHLVFTHFDEVEGNNLVTASDKANHVIGNMEQVLNLLDHDKKNNIQDSINNKMFFLGGLDKNLKENLEDDITLNELHQFIETLNMTEVELQLKNLNFIYYKQVLPVDLLEVSEQFNNRWKAQLGRKTVDGIVSLSWPTIKALSRRYAEFNRLSYNNISPAGDMVQYLKGCLYQYFSIPNYFMREERIDEKKVAQFRTKAMENAAELITIFSKGRLLDDGEQLVRWKRAYYDRRGPGSTSQRAQDISEIIDNAMPLFNKNSNNKEFKILVESFITSVIEVVIANMNDKYSCNITLE
ncbi:hypothetical protein BSK56_24850 [Paenibacillus borealis]|uniref:Uncharacterized protein n=1 Tax=Paenibacillus borealis TaxID=160799 RepID=A0ABX3H0T3_PAEBO|nr:hypothetical protein [Paenibacillus borealis]OMD42775.1 hypothetical protein BSK56_24850 [Paenibacillus borealis]